MWINTNTNQYPVSEGEIRAAYPNTSFPVPFQAPEEYAPVIFKPYPEYDPITQGFREIAPELTEQGYEQRWEVFALDAETAAANQAAADKRLEDSIVQQTQKRLDDFARTRNYDGILSACTYSDSLVQKFRSEGQYCLSMRDQTWAKLYEMLAEVQAGTRPRPTGYTDVESELPVLEWPAA